MLIIYINVLILNNRLRKRHQFSTPNEVYLQKLKNNEVFVFTI